MSSEGCSTWAWKAEGSRWTLSWRKTVSFVRRRSGAYTQVPSKCAIRWSISVETQFAASLDSLPISEPAVFVKRTRTSPRRAAAAVMRGVMTGMPSFVWPFAVAWGRCIFWRSILTTSPCLSRLLPLLVAHPSTPKAPIYRGGTFDRSGSGATSGVETSSPLMGALAGAELRGAGFGFFNFFHVPSKYMFTASSRLPRQASRIMALTSRGIS